MRQAGAGGGRDSARRGARRRGVGSLLVQLAAAAGSRVVALAGGRDKLDLARSLGADVAIDYRDAGWPDAVRTAADGGVDVGVRRRRRRRRPGGLRARAPRCGRFVAFGARSGPRFTRGDDAEAEAARGVVRPTGLGRSPAELLELAAPRWPRAPPAACARVVGQTFALEGRRPRRHAAMEARATRGQDAAGGAARRGRRGLSYGGVGSRIWSRRWPTPTIVNRQLEPLLDPAHVRLRRAAGRSAQS
jgi:NADPH2:quinone reductase